MEIKFDNEYSWKFNGVVIIRVDSLVRIDELDYKN